MANYCDYEIHARGSKKAALFMFTCMPAADYKEITHEEGTDDDYIVWMTGNCKWDLDSYCREQPDVKIDLSTYSEDDIRDEDCGLPYWYLTMRQKSEVLGLKVEAHSWSDESEFDQFDVYDSGKLVDKRGGSFIEYPDYELVESDMSYQTYCECFGVDPNKNPPPVWNKSEYPSYSEFCEAFGIDSSKLPESTWEEEEQGKFYCNIEVPEADRPDFNFTFTF